MNETLSTLSLVCYYLNKQLANLIQICAGITHIPKNVNMLAIFILAIKFRPEDGFQHDI